MSDEIKLQPLRIPGGWTVEINNLCEVDPAEEHIIRYFSGSTLFYAINGKIAVDVCWRPEEEVDGEYVVSKIDLASGETWDDEELFRTRDRLDLVRRLERFLKIAQLDIEIERFSRV